MYDHHIWAVLRRFYIDIVLYGREVAPGVTKKGFIVQSL